MTTRRKLSIDALPLYATDDELAVAILGKRAKDWPIVLRLYESRGFPKISAVMKGRYVPAIIQFFDANEGVGVAEAPAKGGVEKPWPKSSKSPRQASNGADGRMGR